MAHDNMHEGDGWPWEDVHHSVLWIAGIAQITGKTEDAVQHLFEAVHGDNEA